MYDVVIIGAGVIGSSVARFLTRYKANICVVERAEDVCDGTSKANSGIVHAGFDAPEGSLMAKYNLMGNRMMPDLAGELDFPFEQNGSLVVCLDKDDLPKLQRLYERGVKNGVKELELVDEKRLRELEPNIGPNAVAALWAPTGGIVCPFGLTIALAENAADNGAEFMLNTKVLSLTRSADDTWTVSTDKGELVTRAVVNAAGVYADFFHNMVSESKIHIAARRGDYMLLDRSAAGFIRHTIFQLPDKLGKGVLISPTLHGNTIVGPTAVDIDDKEGTNTTAEGLADVARKALDAVDKLPLRQVITSFAGLRAHEDGHEFIIGWAKDAEGFFDCAGIESPGLASSPAIGLCVSDMIAERLHLHRNPDFKGERKGILDPKKLSITERNALIKSNPAYGRVVCRCETVTEGEILDAIHRSLGARSLDAVKRRTRAGMGRCQSGFCSPRVMEILSRELGVDMAKITKCGKGSELIEGLTKDDFTGETL